MSGRHPSIQSTHGESGTINRDGVLNPIPLQCLSVPWEMISSLNSEIVVFSGKYGAYEIANFRLVELDKVNF